MFPHKRPCEGPEGRRCYVACPECIGTHVSPETQKALDDIDKNLRHAFEMRHMVVGKVSKET